MLSDALLAAGLPSSRDTNAAGLRKHVVLGAIVALAPLVLVLFNPNWFLTRERGIDAWQYVGFFERYANPLHGPGAYKLARLPWILTGFSVHHLLPPLTGAYVLHAIFLCATPLLMFAVLQIMLRRPALAAVVATLFGFFTPMHGSGSWDYHNTESGALYLLSVLVLALPAVIAGRRVALVLAGVVVALTVHANITLVNFLPVLALVHLRMVQLDSGLWPRVPSLGRRLLWMLLGALLITVALGTVNWLVGREFLFFGTLVNMVMHFVSDPQQYQTPYWRPWSAWLPVARHLALLTAIFVAGAWLLTKPHRDAQQRLAPTLIGQFLLMLVLWTIWQAVGQTALDPPGMAQPLIPTGFIALGALLVRDWPEACERHWLATTIGTAVVSAFSLTGALDPVLRPLEARIAAVIGAVGCVVFAAALFQYLTRPRVMAVIVLVVTLAVGNGLMTTEPARYAITDPCKIEPAVYSAIVESSSWLWTIDPSSTRVRSWFDEQEQIHPRAGCSVRVGLVGSAITAMSWVPYVTTPFPMPAPDDVPDRDVQAMAERNGMLALVSSTSDGPERWKRKFERLGLVSTEVGRHTGRVLDSTFIVQVWTVQPRLPDDVRFAAPIIAITDHTSQELNMYGTSKGGLRTMEDRVVFTPTDRRDHVAYPYVKLDSLRTDAWARVVIESPVFVTPTCEVFVQAQGYTNLARLGCTSGTYIVRVPMSTEALRVYLADETGRAFTLPTRIELALSQP